MDNGWTDESIGILERTRRNCVDLSNLHRREYLYFKSWLKYFKLPVIILSALNSVASVGISGYLEQTYISELTCGLALLSGIITSIELYLGVSMSMENELDTSKNFYLLSVDIFKELALKPEHRANCKTFLEQTLSTYCKLMENSNIGKAYIEDQLQPTPIPQQTGFLPVRQIENIAVNFP